MKKKNLIILLLIPFLIALLGVVTINTTFNFIDNDIIAIKWDYDDTEAFKLQDNLYLLEATGVNQKNYPAGAGNALVWSIRNRDLEDDSVYGEIVKQDNKYYLKTLECGEVIITCSNEKGTVFKSMNAIIYENGAIIIQTKIRSSQNNIDQTIYYGEYDLENQNKIKASIDLEINAVPESISTLLRIEEKTDNIEIDLMNNKLEIKDAGFASFTISCGDENIAKNATYSFEVVKDGVNVYSYDDLLYCSNNSVNGEIIVLRKSFESLENAYQMSSSGEVLLEDGKPIVKENNVECFGNYNLVTKKFNFKNEIYRFVTTYNKNYIDQWNQSVATSGGSNYISTEILVGLHIQKNFYGNGYTINMHNLTYPTEIIEVDSGDGTFVSIPHLAKDDLFRGPLPFYALGDHNNMPLVEAFGQDNIGMYVEGNDILINDVYVRNCDFGNRLANLDTVGTVLEVSGNNIKIMNARLANGKNVLRSFSSMHVEVINSMLSYARNFLVSLGTNEYILIDGSKTYDFTDLNGNLTSLQIEDYFQTNGVGDNILNAYLQANFSSKENMKKALLSMQRALSNEKLMKDEKNNPIYKGSMKIKDTFFYQSGIAAISLESMFNGPFLYSNIPSVIWEVLGMLETQEGIPLDSLKTSKIAGLSYPVELEICGNTKFYDYKATDSVDISGLITENISKFAQSVDPSYEGIIDIDKIFPIKQYLIDKATTQGSIYTDNGKTYINLPIAYYGGGLNLSKVEVSTDDINIHFNPEIEIDLLDNYLNLGQGSNMVEMLKNMMLKAVTVVTGYEPFKFICMKGDGYLYGETPNISDLILNNVKGE